MASFKTATLFPHVKLSAPQLTALETLFEQVSMLAPDGAATALSGNVQALTPEPERVQALRSAYAKLKQFGTEVLAQNLPAGGYSVFDSSRPPLYDREATSGLLAEFQAGLKDADSAVSKHDETYQVAALTLLLSEDMLCLRSQALNALKAAEGQATHMWQALKGEADPLYIQGTDIEGDLADERFVKKRLTAWAILARIHDIDTDVYITFDPAALSQCLETFEPGAPCKELTTGAARAAFYLLPVDSHGFFKGLTQPDAGFESADKARAVLAYVSLTA